MLEETVCEYPVLLCDKQVPNLFKDMRKQQLAWEDSFSFTCSFLLLSSFLIFFVFCEEKISLKVYRLKSLSIPDKIKIKLSKFKI